MTPSTYAIHKYVRDENNNPVGVVLALKKDDKVYLGWSKCKTNNCNCVMCRMGSDTFDKGRGYDIAWNRANSERYWAEFYSEDGFVESTWHIIHKEEEVDRPESLEPTGMIYSELIKMGARAARYFRRIHARGLDRPLAI